MKRLYSDDNSEWEDPDANDQDWNDEWDEESESSGGSVVEELFAFDSLFKEKFVFESSNY